MSSDTDKLDILTEALLKPEPSPEGTTYFRLPPEVEATVAIRWGNPGDLPAAQATRTVAGAMLRQGMTPAQVREAIERSSVIVD